MTGTRAGKTGALRSPPADCLLPGCDSHVNNQRHYEQNPCLAKAQPLFLLYQEILAFCHHLFSVFKNTNLQFWETHLEEDHWSITLKL